jgi:hypothetical protein
MIVDVAPIARWGSVALPNEGAGCHSCAGDKNPPDAQWLTGIRETYAFVVEGQPWQQPIPKNERYEQNHRSRRAADGANAQTSSCSSRRDDLLCSMADRA